MKKSLSVVLAGLLLLVVILVTIPMMLSWDQYKALAESKFVNATGRTLHINGALHFALLPTPSATLNDVVIDNPPGAMSKQFATIKSLDVGVALWPLLSKEIRVTHININSPAITLETMADGKNNWTFASSQTSPTPATPTETSSSSAQVFSVDSLAIREGFVRLVNVPQKSQNIVGPFEGNFKIESLQGPFSGRGSVTVNNKLPLRFEAAIDSLPKDATAALPFKLSVYLPDNVASGEFKGTMVRAPSFKVRAETVFATKHLDKILPKLPGMLSPATSLTGVMEYQGTQAKMDNLLFRSGGTEVSGGLAVDLQQRPRITLDLARMALPPEAAATGKAPTPEKETASLAEKLSSGFAQATALLDTAVPLEALDVVLTANQLAFPGQPTFRDVRLAASLNKASVTLQAAEANFNDMDMHLNGELPRQDNGSFASATLQTQVRKGDIQINTTVKLNRDALRLDPLALTQKGETVNGALLYAPKAQPALQVAIKGSTLDLDALLRKKEAAPSTAPTEAAGNNSTDPLDSLDGLQAKISADLGRVIYMGKTAQNVTLSALASDKGLTLDTARIGDLGGMVITAAGTVGSINPLKDVVVNINGKTPDLSSTLRALGNEEAKNLGASQFTANIKGEEKALNVLLDGTIDQGKITLQAIKNNEQLSGTLNVTHPETAVIVRNFAKMNPVTNFGPFTLKTCFAKGPNTLQAKDMVVEMGTAGTLRGDVDIQPQDKGRSINATLQADTLNLAALMGDTATTDTTSTPTQADTTARTWSQEPLKLDGLRDLNGQASIRIGKLLVKKFSIDDFVTDVRFANNTATLNKLAGKFFDAGSFSVTGQLGIGAAGQPHHGDVGLNIHETDGKKLFLALGSNVFEKGKITATQKITFSGASEAQLVSSLTGSGQIDIADAIINGIDLDALADKLYKPNSLSDFAALLDQARAGGQTPIGNVTIPLTIQNGMVQVQETPIKTTKTAMRTKGLINLPSKSLDMMGQITFTEQKNLPPLTLFIKGPISQPQKSFDTRSFTQFYAQKATEKLQNKIEDKVQNKLNKLLGAPESSAPVTTPEVTPTVPSEAAPTGAAVPAPDATAPTSTPAPAAMPQPKPKDQLKEIGTQMLNNLLNGAANQQP